MKTKQKTLVFGKHTITELNQGQLKVINGGGTSLSIVKPNDNTLSCTFCINSSNGPGGNLINQVKL